MWWLLLLLFLLLRFYEINDTIILVAFLNEIKTCMYSTSLIFLILCCIYAAKFSHGSYNGSHDEPRLTIADTMRRFIFDLVFLIVTVLLLRCYTMNDTTILVAFPNEIKTCMSATSLIFLFLCCIYPDKFSHSFQDGSHYEP